MHNNKLSIRSSDLFRRNTRVNTQPEVPFFAKFDDIGDPAPPSPKLHLCYARVLLLVAVRSELGDLGQGGEGGVGPDSGAALELEAEKILGAFENRSCFDCLSRVKIVLDFGGRYY